MRNCRDKAMIKLVSFLTAIQIPIAIRIYIALQRIRIRNRGDNNEIKNYLEFQFLDGADNRRHMR